MVAVSKNIKEKVIHTVSSLSDFFIQSKGCNTMGSNIKINGLFFLFLVFFLSACSPLNEFFINNLSDENLKITLNLKHRYSNTKINVYKLISVPSSGDCSKPTHNNVNVVSENDQISFELPPQRTACLGSSSMGDVLFETLTLESGSKKIVIPVERYKNFFKARDSFVSNIAWTLDFHKTLLD